MNCCCTMIMIIRVHISSLQLRHTPQPAPKKDLYDHPIMTHRFSFVRPITSRLPWKWLKYGRLAGGCVIGIHFNPRACSSLFAAGPPGPEDPVRACDLDALDGRSGQGVGGICQAAVAIAR